MVKKINVVRKSRRRSRRRSPRKSKKNKKSKRRSRRKSNTKKLKGGSGGLQQSPFARQRDEQQEMEILTLKTYFIPRVGGKPKVKNQISYSMTAEDQDKILNLLQKSTSVGEDSIENPMYASK
tara:strand:+ start:2143 stop:2511 length:369 start_codon:yes stop_codon:yes gene_type:complete